MDSEQLFVFLAVVGVLGGAVFLTRFFSADARERRRRRRNYGRTVQKVNRPMVKFTVKTPEDDK